MRRRINIIIDCEDITDENAARMVTQVISSGRVSRSRNRAHYCHCTTFKHPDPELQYVVFAESRNPNSDSFRMYTEKRGG